jgi:hypothetical protein
MDTMTVNHIFFFYQYKLIRSNFHEENVLYLLNINYFINNSQHTILGGEHFLFKKNPYFHGILEK